MIIKKSLIKEKNLIFLISQPRSGSSLLQQIILSSGKVLSVPEPWFMLNLCYTIKETNIEDSYNPRYAQVNFMNFLRRFDNGETFYRNLLKELALKLYNLNDLNGYKYFLDKTPRYYHIIDELLVLFPSARFILLQRNPLSVFASILDYNFNGNINGILRKDRQDDLYLAPKIIEAVKARKLKNVFSVNYESIVRSNVKINELMEFLELPALKKDFTYNVNKNFSNTEAIDQKSVSSHNKPVSDYLYSWKTSINSSEKKRHAIKYIKTLGQDLISSSGYDYDDILTELANHKVSNADIRRKIINKIKKGVIRTFYGTDNN